MVRISEYSRVIERLLVEGKEPEAVFTALQRLLAKEHRDRWYRPILRNTAKRLAASAGVTGYTLTLAKTADEFCFKEAIHTTLAVTSGTVIATRIAPEVIGGYRLTSRQVDIDATYKKRLLDLYHSLIA